MRIRQVLARLGLETNEDVIDAVFALLDDQTDSWFSKAPNGAKIQEGATTAHLACHIGILQRGRGRLDREGRDYWIKPLRELGAIEAVALHKGTFISGHPIPKSPNSAYRLSDGFRAVLMAAEGEWQRLLTVWSSEDAARERREFQARAEEESRHVFASGHSELIRASIDYYAAKFLPDYGVVYVDEGDGDRVTEEDVERLREAGLELTLGDAMPDVLLWNPMTDRLWAIEAVTSDGEADWHKVEQLRKLARRSGKAGIDFTTTYRTWRDAAARQGAQRNVAVGTYIWIQEDPAKSLYVASYATEGATAIETLPLLDRSPPEQGAPGLSTGR